MTLKVKAKAQLMKVGKYANTCRCGKSKRKVEEWGSQIPQITHILNRGLKEKASCRLSAKGFVCLPWENENVEIMKDESAMPFLYHCSFLIYHLAKRNVIFSFSEALMRFA